MRFFTFFLTACVLAGTAFADLDHRKATVTIKVHDQHGNDLNRTLSVTQVSHDFLFGANNGAITSWTALGTYVDVLNSVNFMTYWVLFDGGGSGQYNSQKVGELRYLLDVFQDYNLHLSAHPILYALDSVEPNWVNESHYRDHVRWWHQTFPEIEVVDVVNEPYHEPISNTFQPYIWSQEDSPDTRRRINEYGLLEGSILNQWLPVLQNNKSLYEVIGVQAHHILRPEEVNLDAIRRNLDQIAAVGKPVHITEVSIPSGNLGWTEAKQADHLEALYRLFFETPGVEAVYYWDLSDAGAWNPTSGLWKANGSPKPAWNRLRALVKDEWNSSGSVSVNGTASFTGFLGDYKIDGKTYTLEPGAVWDIEIFVADVVEPTPPARPWWWGKWRRK